MRSLPSSIAQGNQIPTEWVVPESISNDCLEVIDIMEAAGFPLMQWQQLLLESWCGVDEFGKWTANSVGNSVPRQNGKTLTILGRASGEMLLNEGDVIYTSQLQKTSTETFKEMCKLFESRALRRYVATRGIRTALGREEIWLKNGSRIKFLARTRNGGDGQHGSLLIFDEAQALDDQAQESFLPAVSAAQARRGSQVIYNGTPPKRGDYGLIFERLRNDALGGKTKRLVWTEWSAGYGGRVPDQTNRILWERMNPSYGILIPESVIERESETMESETFAHQRLGWWTGQRAAQTLISETEWRALESESPETWERLAYGVRFSPDGSLVALSVAVLNEGRVHVEFIRQEPTARGIRWLVDWLVEREDECACIAIDGKSAADDLKLQLLDRRFPKQAIKVAGTDFASNAAAAMVNGVADGTVTHYPTEELDSSATKSVRRRIGTSGGFGFAGEHAEIIESAGLALYAVRTTRRDPKRKAVAW